MPPTAAIILAGGRSTRMGSPKAALDWHGSTLLRRVTGVALRSVDGPVVVVRAPGQELPALDAAVEVVADAREGRGPLEGLAAGMAAVGDRAAGVYVSSTDLPLLHPAFVHRVTAALDDGVDVVLPRINGFRQPLSAAYRVALLPEVQALVAADRLKPAFLFERCEVLELDDRTMLRDPALARLDPQLASVSNLNEPGEYRRAHERPAPDIEVRRLGTPAVSDGHRSQTIAAWRLGELAGTIRVPLDHRVAVLLNDQETRRDPELPLVRGDSVTFIPAGAAD